jgi:hypothetical protein
MIILGFDTAIINWYLVLYVVSSVVFLVYGTNAVYPTGQIRAVIFAIGSALVLFYFGLRWFATPKTAMTQWPPVINMCPDYLTYIRRLSDNKPGCVDMLGISKNGQLRQTLASDLSGLTSTVTNKVFPYTSDEINTAISGNDRATITAICNSCKNNGITWEGVFDGDSCIGLNTFNTSQDVIQKCLISV